jgi:hypothetical protein
MLRRAWVIKGLLGLALVTLLVLFAGTGPAAPPAAEEINLTGTWQSDETCPGTFYVRQVGKTLWWSAKSADEGKAWTKVFRGTIKDDTISGDWADVPPGGGKGSGTLTLHVVIHGGKLEIKKKRQTGDAFAASTWKRQQ